MIKLPFSLEILAMPLAFIPNATTRFIKPTAKFLTGFFAVMVLLLVMGLLGIIIFSESLLRTLIEVKGSQVLKREIRVEGDINVQWHWRYIDIRVTQVDVQQREQSDEKKSARIDTIDLQVEPLQFLRDASLPFRLAVLVKENDTKISIDGKFHEPLMLDGMDARLLLTGASLADLFYLTAIPLPPTPPYRLEGQLSKSGARWGYRDFNGQVGNSDLAGNLAYDLGGARGFLTADLKSTVLDAADLGGFIGLGAAAEAEKTQSDKIIPNVPLARERLLATNLDVHLHAAKIVAPALPFKGMNARFYLRDGILKLAPLNVVLADGTLEGNIEIDANPMVPPMQMNLVLRRLNLNRFFKGTRFESTSKGFFGGNISLAGAGESLAAVLASSHGETTVIMSGGEISLLLIEAADLDLGQALPLFLGEDKATRIHCGVINFNVQDGLLSSDVVALDTADSLVTGSVNIDLKQENINARLDAKPKDTSLLALRIPITIKGNLKSPTIGLDKEKTASRSIAAVALGALLTPFAAMLAFVEDGDEQETDCRALLNKAGD